MVTEVTDFQSICKGNVLVDFYTMTCGPCKALSPILEDISNEFQNIRVAKVDVTRNPEVSNQFGVMSVPTIVFMKNSKIKNTIRGLKDKNYLRSMVRKYLSD